MSSELIAAMIVNLAVWVSVLATDLGPARKVGVARIVRPLVVAAVIVPLFVAAPATAGTGLALEIAGTVLGVLGGLAAVALMRVYRRPGPGHPLSAAGWGYATLWTAVIAARAVFSYGSAHWWTAPLVRWAVAHRVTGDAVTDALILMAVAMLVTRTLGLWARASRVPAPATAEV